MPESQESGSENAARSGEQAPHIQDAPTTGNRTAETMGPMGLIMATALGFGGWILIGLGVAAIFSAAWRTWWSANWIWVLVGAIVVIALFAGAFVLLALATFGCWSAPSW